MSDNTYGKWLSSPLPGEEVVISGISGRLPSSENIVEFRENLFNKRNLTTDYSKRCIVSHPEIPQKTGIIGNIENFDAGYFGIHHRQANSMDPLIRIFLETATEAILDAGVNPSELEGTKTGVFVGACYSDMECEILSNITGPQRFGITGYLRCFVSNRLSYHLKLKGPSVIVDAACSSSLNALELAFKAIRNGQCDSAIVGGVNLLLHPGVTLQFARLGVLSMDGICKVFDEEANGYSRSDTIACVFVQKAKNARRIYAQIVYGKVNCDGFKTQGITFPSIQMQKELMTEVLEDSKLTPSDLNYLEAHGTGTEVGDPQEVEAIDLAIAKKRSKPLQIGSVKCNIGHSEPASGLCSLIKIIIAMETGLISPNINLKKIKSSLVGLWEGRMKVATELTELEGNEAIVGINNFGFGGNNCNMIVRRFKKKKILHGSPGDNLPRLVCVSGRTKDSVESMLNYLREKPLDAEYVGLLHQIFKKNIVDHIYRGYVIVSKAGSSGSSNFHDSHKKLPFYVVFGNFTSNFSTLGKYLLDFPAFKSIILRINTFVDNLNITDEIISENTKNVNKTLASIIVQIGLIDILKLLNLQPISCYVDSIGKLLASYYREELTLKETVLEGYKISKSSNFVIEDNKTLNTIEKSSILLNISDSSISQNEILFVKENSVTFLDALGRLYELGYNPLVDKLYPEIDFPVSRNTPMISPLIKWEHTKRWYTYKFTGFTVLDVKQKIFNLSYLDDEYRYIQGHVIDGRNFIAATEYLNIVWQSFAESLKLLTIDTPVIFENCRFNRALTIPKNGYLKLMVSIQEGSGDFEILEKDSIAVSGRIYMPKDINSYSTNIASDSFDDKDRTQVLEQDEIYRELYLRGYNYSGLFKGIVKCNVEASKALIKWEDNWTTFMDKMLQMKIIQEDSRLLFVPIGIKRLILNPGKHHQLVNEAKELLPVEVYKEINVVKSGGIEIHGLQAKSIAKKKPPLDPVLEKHQFVPNEASFDLVSSVRVNTQIILENVMEHNFKAVEIIENYTDSEFILPIVDQVLANLPLVNPDLTISTKTTINKKLIVKVEDYVFSILSNLTLIVGNKILQRSNLKTILTALKSNGFILTREEKDSVVQSPENFQVITEYTTSKEKLILFRRVEVEEDIKVIKVPSANFEWLPELQDALKNESRVIVYSQNEEVSGILGLVNCIRREPKGNQVRCYFIMDKEAPRFDPRDSFYAKQLEKDLAVNIYKNSKWGTYRHLLLEEAKEVEGDHFYINTTTVGDLSSLRWIQGSLTPQTPLKDDEMLVYNYYAPLNFKDIMIASGRLTAETFARERTQQDGLLGFEFSGRDQNGRRVSGLTRNGKAIGTVVVADKNVLWEIPDSWTMEEAATVPAVYSTVLYALFYVTNLKPGNSILIHSATGGVGIAAINVCLHYGCKIFATVGTQEKRDFLRRHFPQIPERNIGNSRDTSFEKMVKMETRGRGVDFVLNSLTDEKLKASVRCLAKGGHFVEIGKYDLANDTLLEMSLVEKEISYHGVMLDQIFDRSVNRKQWLLNKMKEGIDEGYVKPLPRIVFKSDEVEKAFRYMTTGKHMGKVLVKIREEEKEKVVKASRTSVTGNPRFHCEPQKSYIIIGGLGGFGMELADWLVLRGAQKLILVTSSGVKTGYQTQRIRVWRSYGVDVHITKTDVTTKEGCIQLIEESKNLGPIDGIFNLAVVLRDALFEDQTEEKFRTSFSPKANATEHLDKVTREFCPELRYFVIFSSVSCGRGNAGQTNYGMANSIMERICERRNKDGFPALAIQWGAIGDVGLVAKMQKENRELVIGGTLQQKVSSCLLVLDKFLNQGNSIVSSMIVAEKHYKDKTESAVEAVANILGIKDIKSINDNLTLVEFGIDSMTATEIVQLLEADYSIYLSPKEMKSLTFAKLKQLEAKDGALENEVSEKNTNMILQYIPDGKINRLPIIKLPSNISNSEKNPKAFVLCGIEGLLKTLETLTQKLNAELFGLQYSYDNPEDSVQDIARNMLPLIEDYVNQEKTFTIVAYSFGAVVAFELISLLESKGFTGKLIAIEGSPSYIAAAAKNYLPGETEEEIQSFVVIKILSMIIPTEVCLQNKEKFLKCKNFDERIEVGLSLIPQNIKEQILERQGVITLYKRFKALTEYRFMDSKIKSSVYLLKAKYPMVKNMENDYDWSKLCEKNVEVSVFEGDHVTILKQKELVETVNNLFQK